MTGNTSLPTFTGAGGSFHIITYRKEDKPYVKRHDDAHNSREVPMRFLFHDGIYIFNVVIYIFNVGIYIFNDVK